MIAMAHPYVRQGVHRVYVSPDRADAFVKSFLRFSRGKTVSDNAHAPGVEIGRPGDIYRRARIESVFGKVTVLVTDGHLPFPYGREMSHPDVMANALRTQTAT
jgi:hypothetical protein